MSTDAARPAPFAIPRPGVVKTLGILNIVISVLIGIGLSLSFFWLIMMAAGRSSMEMEEKAQPVLQARPDGANIPAPSRTNSFPMMGMNDPNFVRFTWVDAVTGAILNLLMFVTGLGLINLRPWAARWWTWVAWVKIARLVLLWGFFIVVVSPTLSDNMARAFFEMVKTPPGGRGRMPSVGDMKRIYSTMLLITAAGMILLGSIYPAVSLWMIGRPGVRAALGPNSSQEPNQP